MSGGTLRRWAPLALLILAGAAVWLTGLHGQLSLDGLREHREALLAFVAAHSVLAPIMFTTGYAAAVALSLPGALFLTLAGGFVFGPWLGGLCAVLGGTAGAVALFLIARTALGSSLRDRAGTRLQRLEAGFQRDAFSYLLILRLVPLLPFWLVNLVPALLGMPLRLFAAATFLGIIPAAFVFAGVGSGLGAVLEAGGTPNLGLILEPRILLPLLGLAALALVPVVYRRWAGRPKC